jgi:hypothetical protein
LEQVSHFDGVPFTRLSTMLATHEGRSDMARISVQPAAKHHFTRQPVSFAGEVRKDYL